jgi:3-oxoadipate enol-lactonase
VSAAVAGRARIAVQHPPSHIRQAWTTGPDAACTAIRVRISSVSSAPVTTASQAAAPAIQLSHQTIGELDSPPMVLLHALGERGADWAPVTAQFSQRFRVVTLDMRGHGDSAWPGTYSFQLMCDDVLATVDHLALPTFTLMGHSMGGVVAYLIAMQQPDRVEHLIIEDAPPPFPRDRAIPVRPGESLDFDWDVVPAIIGQVNEGDPAMWDGLDAITAPTLLIGGGPDSHIPQDKLALVAARIPRCDMVTIPAGHHVHTARPAEFASAVLTWLGG